MTLSQIKLEIESNTRITKDLQSQIANLMRRNNDLNSEYNIKILEHFKEYLEIGTTYNVETWLNLSGIQTGVKEGDKIHAPNFNHGDSFSIIKKNNKSIVIKVNTKIMSTYSNGTNTKTIHDNPGWTFRIELESLYEQLSNKDKNFKESFSKYLNRKEALESLGI